MLYESRTFPQLAIPLVRITKLEVCRGGQACARTVANNAPGGLLMGIVLGAAAGVLGEGVGSALTWREAELDEAAAQGALYGAALGATAEGGRGGDGRWQEVTVEQLRQEIAAPSVPQR